MLYMHLLSSDLLWHLRLPELLERANLLVLSLPTRDRGHVELLIPVTLDDIALTTMGIKNTT